MSTTAEAFNENIVNGSVHASPAEKYITFKLGDEEYAFEIDKVREIIGLIDIVQVPKAPPEIRGVINLRGKVNPVVDLRAVFGMSPTVAGDTTVIVIVQLRTGKDTFSMGVLVDEVLEVLNIEAARIEPPPNFGDFAAADSDQILGVAKVSKRVIFLLDINHILHNANGTAV